MRGECGGARGSSKSDRSWPQRRRRAAAELRHATADMHELKTELARKGEDAGAHIGAHGGSSELAAQHGGGSRTACDGGSRGRRVDGEAPWRPGACPGTGRTRETRASSQAQFRASGRRLAAATTKHGGGRARRRQRRAREREGEGERGECGGVQGERTGRRPYRGQLPPASWQPTAGACAPSHGAGDTRGSRWETTSWVGPRLQ